MSIFNSPLGFNLTNNDPIIFSPFSQTPFGESIVGPVTDFFALLDDGTPFLLLDDGTDLLLLG